MKYQWYTVGKFIRTYIIMWNVREFCQRKALVPFTVIDDDIKVIVKDIDGIDKGVDHVPAEERIGTIAFCEPVQEEQNAVTVEKLGLRIAEGFDRNAEGFGSVLQFF